MPFSHSITPSPPAHRAKSRPMTSSSSCVISRSTLPRRELPRTLIRNHIHNTPDPIHNFKEQAPNKPTANALLGEQAAGPSGNPLVFLCSLGASPPRQSHHGDYRIRTGDRSGQRPEPAGGITERPAMHRIAARSLTVPPAAPHGDYRIRTGDPLLAKQMLYQLS